MARPHPLRVLVQSELPPLSARKKFCYRPNIREVRRIYRLLNKYVFNDRLSCPPIALGICRGYYGACEGLADKTRPGTYCKIRLSNKWTSIQRMITVLAHEMVHQYQWDVYSVRRERQGLTNIMSHGPSFFEWKDRLAEFAIDLRTAYNTEDLLK